MTGEERRRFEAALEAWEESILRPALARAPERDALFQTSWGTPIQPLYTPRDLVKWDSLRDLGLPGAFPYTRGV